MKNGSYENGRNVKVARLATAINLVPGACVCLFVSGFGVVEYMTTANRQSLEGSNVADVYFGESSSGDALLRWRSTLL